MLDDSTFKSELRKLMKDCKDSEKSSEDFADGLVDLIKAFVKTGEVTIAAGIPVTTAGSATSQTGATSEPGTGTIS